MFKKKEKEVVSESAEIFIPERKKEDYPPVYDENGNEYRVCPESLKPKSRALFLAECELYKAKLVVDGWEAEIARIKKEEASN